MRGERRIDRRSVLRAAAGGAVLGAGAPFIDLSAQSASAKPLDRSLQPVLMAMHIHASFSEGIGSMEAHLSEAERTGVDVIWWTEHDHRMVARNYLNTVHFNGLYEWSKGAAVTWRSTYAGSLASSTATIVTDPVSADPGGKALRMTADSAGAAGATRTVTAAVGDGRLNTSIDGTTIGIDVYPQAIGDDSWFDIVVETSYRPARYERSGGQYRMRYRVGGGRPVGTVREVSPLDGLIVVDAPADAWTRLSLDLVPDLESLWPDIDFRDAALTNYSFAVTSRNSSATKVVVDGLTFD